MDNFTYSQKQAYDAIRNGYNTFITGGGGVGKTFLLRKIIQEFGFNGLNVMICAPTGIASMGLGGVTLHRAFEAPLGALTYSNKTYIASEELVNSDIVIIDEISMCRIDMFDFISNKILDANRRRKVMGKPVIQLIVSGDFFQLPPVTTGYEKKALDRYYGYDIGLGYAFQSKFWKYFNFKTVFMNEVVRQKEYKFIHNLDKVRTGSKAYIDELHKMSSINKIDNAITICGKNSEVNEINSIELAKIDNVEYVYSAVLDGEAMESDVIADVELRIKVGAKVMTLINNDYHKNGSIGVVKALYSDAIVLQMENGVEAIIRPYTWDIYKYTLEKDDNGEEKLVKQIAGKFTQFPVKLAYAITIHKSQGQTYDKANISPYCWDCGQIYVALSRVRDIGNIYFNYNPSINYVIVSLNVIDFYNDSFKNNNVTVVKEDNVIIEEDTDIKNILNKLKQI